MSIGTNNTDGTNAKGTVYIPNPSDISIAVVCISPTFP